MIPFNLICNMNMFCGQNICYHVAAFNDLILKKLIFDLLTHPRVEGDRDLQAKYLLSCCCIPVSI